MKKIKLFALIFALMSSLNAEMFLKVWWLIRLMVEDILTYD